VKSGPNTNGLFWCGFLAGALMLASGCDDGNSNGGAGDVDAGPPGEECTEDANCDDNDRCTVDQCENGFCVYSRPPDVTPDVVGVLNTTGGARAMHLRGNRLHVAEGASGVETFDLGPLPDAPTRLGQRTTAGEALVVMEWNGNIYVAEGPLGVEIFPADGPTALSLYDTEDDAVGLYTWDSTLVVAAFAKGVELVNVDDVNNPYQAAKADTVGRAMDVRRQGNRLLVADGLAGMAELDAEDWGNIQVLGDRRIETEGRALALAIRGRYLLLAEHMAGVGIIDRQHEEGPTRVATFQDLGVASDIQYLGRYTALVAAGSSGLVVLDLIDPEKPKAWKEVQLDGDAISLSANQDRVAVAMGDEGVAIINLNCPVPEEGG
jgi:hypothetical protein